MSLHHIHVYPDAVLKREAAEITIIDDELRQLARDMLTTMYAAPGVGLAAPQVGVSRRLIVADPGEERGREPLILVNPVIVAGAGTAGIEEGCLSVPDFTAEVIRQAQIQVRGFSLDERELEFTVEGFAAIVLQHEIDHLNGLLFIDRISPLKRDIFLRRQRKQRRAAGP
ncbi:MAG: peptide deformylase [Deltaproteobacteria bacterium]|nr:peptide deformylase [Candidatus Anaeroferrophillacea bacterium]